MKKILSLIFVLAMLLSTVCLFASCGGETTDEPEETTTKEAEVTTKGPNTEPIAMKIGDTPIEDFTIVYAHSAYDASSISSDTRDKMDKWTDFDLECGGMDKDYTTASRLKTLIKKYTGKDLTLKKDTAYTAEEGSHAIYVGNTKQKAVSIPSPIGKPGEFADQIDNYVMKVDEDGSLIIRGGCEGTTWHAVDKLEKLIKDAYREGASFEIGKATDLSGTYHIKLVACIGDSITAGARSSNASYLCYVADLNRLLWQDYYFFNYGNSGKTMRSDLADKYQATSEYKAVTKGDVYYDIVTIMLGTNDSNRQATGTWTSAQVQNFKFEMEDLMAKIDYFSGGAKFIVMNVPEYWDTGAFGDDYVKALQLETAKEIYAKGEYDILFYDMHSYTAKEMGSKLFDDGLHPNDQGYEKMAEGIATMLLSLEGKAKCEYMIDITK